MTDILRKLMAGLYLLPRGAYKRALCPALLALSLISCVAQVDDAETLDELEEAEQGIYRGPGAFGDIERLYPEFVTVSTDLGLCSGVLLDSQVVLTAGHCWNGGPITVTRDGIGRHSVDRVVVWGRETGDHVADVMIAHLTTPIYVGVLPEIEPVLRIGDKVTYLGRIDHYNLTNHGNGIRGRTISWIGQNKAQSDWSVLQRGDSGGPVFLDYSHRLVGINSYIYGDNETRGSLDGFTRLHPDLALSIQRWAADFGGPGTNVRIHWGR
jgi:hypothetical protein